MARSPGKQFEEDWKKSVPFDVYFYRLRDGTSNWGNDKENTRFQQTNDYDCFMFKSPLFIPQELKSYNNTSYFMSSLRKNQIEGLRNALKYQNSIPGIVFNIRLINRTFFVHWSKMEQLVIKEGKKHKFMYQGSPRASIPNQWIIDNGIEVVAWKKKVHYAYDIRGLIDKLDNF